MIFFGAVLDAGYGASGSKIEYEYQKRQRFSESNKFQVENLKERKRRLVVFISKMKHDGLIKRRTQSLQYLAMEEESSIN